MQQTIRELDLDRITPNLRCIYEDEVIEELARSILSSGQLEPITVWFAWESFRILDGEKRWRACKRLRLTRMRVVIAEVETSSG